MSSANPSSSSSGGGGGGAVGSSSTGTSGGGGGGGGGGSAGGGGPCGACKFLRRKCVAGCIFAPYFDSEQGAAHFAAVHKVFGASNVSKLLLHIPVHKRLDAVVTICYEAQARLRDPVFGCVAHIFALQQQVVNLQAELSYLQGHLATLELPPPPAQPQQIMAPPSLTIADLPTAGSSSVPATYDLSSLFDHPVLVQHPPPQWTMQPPRQMDSHHQFGAGGTRAPTAEASSGDLQELARELLHRQGSSSSTVPCNNMEASTLPPHSSK